MAADSKKEDSNVRRRYTPENDPEWNPDLPYGGKVYLARKMKPDPLHVRLFEVKFAFLTLKIYSIVSLSWCLRGQEFHLCSLDLVISGTSLDCMGYRLTRTIV